jgi:ribulose bisphosphate carboxylase small subunit
MVIGLSGYLLVRTSPLGWVAGPPIIAVACGHCCLGRQWRRGPARSIDTNRVSPADQRPSAGPLAQALRAGYRCANDIACVTAFRNPSSKNGSHATQHNGQVAHPLRADIVDAIRQQLRQGHHIGLEFADTRRFKAGSWQNGPTIASTHEAQALTQVEQFLTDHPGDYVRLLGIDPKAKQRQWEQMIQKPE